MLDFFDIEVVAFDRTDNFLNVFWLGFSQMFGCRISFEDSY